MYQAVPFPLLTDGTVAALQIFPHLADAAPGRRKAGRLARALVHPRPAALVFFTQMRKGRAWALISLSQP